MPEPNRDYLRKLQKKVKDEDLRQEIILLDTFIGAYNARIEMPEFFKEKKQIVGQVYESVCIANQRENTLSLLERINPEEVYVKRKTEMKEIIETENIKEEGLYDYSKRFIKNRILMQIGGRRIENRLLNSGKKWDWIIERDRMAHELIREIDNMNLQKFK